MTKRRKVESLDVPGIPLNFLLTCSDRTLGSYELKKLADVSDVRDELLALLDKFVEEMAQAALVRWFRNQDRESLKRAIENPDDIEAWAKEQIRKQGRKDAEEQGKLPTPSAFRPALPPGKAHIAASLRYQQRNVAAGKCSVCPQPLDRNSVRYCTEHLRKMRERERVRAMQGGKPPHGRHPNSVAAIAKGRKGKNEALLDIIKGTANEEREKRRNAWKKKKRGMA